jgi:hypothetical protein
VAALDRLPRGVLALAEFRFLSRCHPIAVA